MNSTLGMAMGETTKRDKQPMVENEFIYLRESVEKLNAVTSKLLDRLSPVVRNEPMLQSESEKDVELNCPLAQSIKECRHRIQQVNSRVDRYLDILEI